MSKKRLQIDEFELEQTCSAFPEAYDVYLNEKLVGDLRLRHGYFSCHLSVDGEEIYNAVPEGQGEFEDNERQHHLSNAICAIRDRLKVSRTGNHFMVSLVDEGDYEGIVEECIDNGEIVYRPHWYDGIKYYTPDEVKIICEVKVRNFNEA